eukprot:GHVO01006194.1.p1 GENE.GHVO01006194.1~~GHVO01006194.1.p1  ORF type:complete len:502 (-),score=88.70 GHVO01006194.1:58-1563(-)
MSQELILRIHSAAGRFRLSLKPSTTIKDLKDRIASRIGLTTSDDISLFSDPQYQKPLTRQDSLTLSHMRLSSGSELYVLCGGATQPRLKVDEPKEKETSPLKETSAPKSTSSKDVPKSTSSKDVPKSTSSAAVPKSTSNANDGKGGNSDSSGRPKFENFDSFLLKREFNTTDLPLCVSFAPAFINRGTMMKLPSSVTLKHQQYRHVDHLEFMAIDSIHNFVQYWKGPLNMDTQRAGLMYGYFRNDEHYVKGVRAVVEAIYEPMQHSDGVSVRLLPDPNQPSVDAIASFMGLEPIGWIFTHLARDELLTSEEVRYIGEMQLNRVSSNHYTGYPVSPFVTCTIAPSELAQGETVPNVFMVSDLGMAMVRDGILCESDDRTHMKVRESVKNEVMPEILEGGKSVKAFDADWLIVRVNESAPKNPKSKFTSSVFPRLNRGELRPQMIREHILANSSKPNPQQYNDFHLLIAIAAFFDMGTALTVCEALATNTPVDPALHDVFQTL